MSINKSTINTTGGPIGSTYSSAPWKNKTYTDPSTGLQYQSQGGQPVDPNTGTPYTQNTPGWDPSWTNTINKNNSVFDALAKQKEGWANKLVNLGMAAVTGAGLLGLGGVGADAATSGMGGGVTDLGAVSPGEFGAASTSLDPELAGLSSAAGSTGGAAFDTTLGATGAGTDMGTAGSTLSSFANPYGLSPDVYGMGSSPYASVAADPYVSAATSMSSTPINTFGPLADGYGGATTTAAAPDALSITSAPSIDVQQGLADVGKLMGNMASAGNLLRNQQAGMTQNYDKLALDAQNARNQNESDALSKLAVTNYLLNGKVPQSAPQISINGKTYNPQFPFTPPPISAAQKQGAEALQPSLINRLGPNGSYTPQPLSSYATPGGLEKTGIYGSIIPASLGIANNFGLTPSTIANGVTDAGKWLGSLFGW